MPTPVILFKNLRLFEFQDKFLTCISFCVHVKDGNDNYTVQLDMFTGNGFFIISQFENFKVSHIRF